MFRLFRKIREDKVSERKKRRYLNYAIGELILVVFGILIALQINNWNEERNEQRQIAEYAHALIKDLEPDCIGTDQKLWVVAANEESAACREDLRL
jgi:hypothetical protein